MFVQIGKQTGQIVAGNRGAVPALIAFLMGSFILLGAGLVQSDTLHNAAHDSRHSFAFPCH